MRFLKILMITMFGIITSQGYALEANDYCGEMPDFCCYQAERQWFFTSDALIFKTTEDGLGFGTATALGPIVTGSPIEVDSRIKNIHPHWNAGFRLGAGYNNLCHCWDLRIFWTHFCTHAHTNLFNQAAPINSPPVPLTNFFTPGWGHATPLNIGPFTYVENSEVHWKMNLDIVDLELGRSFLISSCISLRPTLGIRAAWIHQSLQMTNTGSERGIAINIQDIRLKSDFEGLGLKTGLESEWDLGCGFNLYGSTGGVSSLWPF